MSSAVAIENCKFYSWAGFFFVWYFVIWFSLKIAKGLWTTWLADALGQGHKWRVGPDSWAVVTGATDGIGLEYAKELGKKGYNLLLISRNPEKLENVKKDLEAKCPKCKEIRVLSVDFSKLDIYPLIHSEVSKLPEVSVLVNNVGTSYCTPELFTHLEVTNSKGFLDQLINTNIISCTKMLQIVLPRMEQAKSGVVINVSSLSAAYPTPLLSVYGASKIYMDFLSRGLQAEYRDTGIIIQSVLPSYVATKLSKIRKASLLVPTPASYVKGALRSVGLEDRTYGYWSHKVQGFVQDRIISGIFGEKYNTTLALSSLKGIRSAYYRKYVNKKD